MPAEGLDWLPRADVLTDAEVVRLVRIAVERLGISEVRFTGGEPLLRQGLVDIVAATAALRPRPNISLTTNGIGLTRLAGPLADAGLDRVNVSLDTLDPVRFEALTRRDRLADVLDGLTAAADAGLVPVKINSVLMRGINDDESPDLLRFALKNGYELRFIEQMPLDAGHIWDRAHHGHRRGDPRPRCRPSSRCCPTRRTAAPHRPRPGSSTAYPDAKVGIIASVTRPFCGDCDRTRLTADGQVRNCLFGRDESDLRAAAARRPQRR